VTCGREDHYKKMQAGHFVSKAQGNGVYWDIRNIHVQCYRCNINLGSNGPEYYKYMLKTYGEDVINEIMGNAHKTIKITAPEYEDMIKDYKEKLDLIERD